MVLLSIKQFRFFGILGLILLVSIPVQSQNTKEIGAELTKKYANEMDMSISNPMRMNGKDAWIFTIPEDFTFSYLKEKAEIVSNELNVEILVDWKKEGNIYLYGFMYENQNFAIGYSPENNMLVSMIEPTGSNEVDTDNNGEWKTIKTFSGSGIKNTAPFTVNNSEWKVIYESKASMQGMNGAGHIFQLFLLKPGQEMFEGEIIANDANKETIKGESFVYKSGRFYFNSNSANGDWKIIVQVKD